MDNEESVKRIINNFTDDELINEFVTYEKLINIDNFESTLLIEYFDLYYPIVMHELADRYLHKYLERENKVLQFKLV